MSWRWIGRFTTLAVVVMALAVVATPAVASSPQPTTYERLAAAPYCGKSLWSSGKRSKTKLGRKFTSLIRIIENLDDATDIATAVFAVLSGPVSAPALAIKAVAKLGAKKVIKVIRGLADDLGKVTKKKAGVRLKIKCAWGVVPYPSFGLYT